MNFNSLFQNRMNSMSPAWLSMVMSVGPMIADTVGRVVGHDDQPVGIRVGQGGFEPGQLHIRVVLPQPQRLRVQEDDVDLSSFAFVVEVVPERWEIPARILVGILDLIIITIYITNTNYFC